MGEVRLPVLEVRRLGRTLYADAHRLQQELLEQRLAGSIRDQLLLTEHEPVVTLGRRSGAQDAARAVAPVFEIERGGEATWHGPGQLVAYPILQLAQDRHDLHRYLRDLEEVVIRLLAEFEVLGTRCPGKTGVWIGQRKVCSLGVAVRRWVTWHGLALNLHNALEPFEQIKPCGLDAGVMTRLADHCALPPGSMLVEVLLVKHFCEVFGRELPPAPQNADNSSRGAWYAGEAPPPSSASDCSLGKIFLPPPARGER